MERKTSLCSQCGAPLSGDQCGYCGALFGTGKHSLHLVSPGNHPGLVVDLLREMAEYYYSPSDHETTSHLTSVAGIIEKETDSGAQEPLLILRSDSLKELLRWQKKIEGNGGRTLLE